INESGELVFEYELPRSGGRRPDVILIIKNHLLVLEFKGYNQITDIEMTQTSLYVRDLLEYHSYVQDTEIEVKGLLVFPSKKLKADIDHSIYLVPNDNLVLFIEKLSNN